MFSRAFTATILAMAALFLGSWTSVSTASGETAVARDRSAGLDMAVLGDVNDAEGDEAQGDSCACAWNTISAIDGLGPSPCGGRFVASHRDDVTWRHCRAVALIRGPPLRG